jgi:hypothetical protein
VEEATDFEGCCGMVYHAAVDGEAGVGDEDFNVWWESTV